MGALDEAALYVATADDQDAARAEVGAVIDRLLGRSPDAGRRSGGPSRRTPSSSAMAARQSLSRVPSGVVRSKSSSSRGMSTKRRCVACAWGSVRRFDS